MTCGPEFGLENVGRVALIHWALYGGKSAGRDFQNNLRGCMWHIRFKSCPANPDMWMQPAKHSDGCEYYEYVLLYTNDTIVISKNAESVLRNELGKYFELKEESIGPPKLYLGGHVSKIEFDNGVKCWSLRSSQYIQTAVKNVETHMAKVNDARWQLPAKADTPLKASYCPELDVSPEFDAANVAYYQSLIGVLRWIAELGCVDVCLEGSMMLSHIALPREGHQKALLQIFAYLKKHHNTEMVYDPSQPKIDIAAFNRKDWTSSEFDHLQGTEELPLVEFGAYHL